MKIMSLRKKKTEDKKDELLVTDNEEINLSEIADNSIDSSFNEIINTKNEGDTSGIIVDENVKIDSNLLESSEDKDNLPIFKEELPEDDSRDSFKKGDKIRHKKYGVGTIVKAIQYEQRQFVQVEFESAGKVLLDPKVADIKLEQ